MRTTLTLDRDVAAWLVNAAKNRRLPFNTVVNDALRAGLAVIDKPVGTVAFQTVGFDLGPSLNNVHGVLARVEGEGLR